jgi:lysozyme
MSYPICQAAVDIIKRYESLHDGDLTMAGLQPKLCPAGIWTAGWGRALRHPETGRFLTKKGGAADKELAYKLCEKLDEEKAELWLKEDLAEFVDKIKPLITAPVNPHQLGALVSLTYNIGIGAFRDSTLRKKVNNLDHSAVFEFHRWNRSSGRILRGLVLRRAAEASLFVAPYTFQT